MLKEKHLGLKPKLYGEQTKPNESGCLYPISLEVNKNSSCDLSDEDEQEAGEVLEEERKKNVTKQALYTY